MFENSKKLFLLFMLLSVTVLGRVEAAEVSCSLNDGMKADGKSILEHGGVKHQFCCSGCLERFKENPEKFAQTIQQPLPTTAKEAEATCSSVCEA